MVEFHVTVNAFAEAQKSEFNLLDDDASNGCLQNIVEDEMVSNLDVNTQASVKLLIIKCTHACLYVQGRSVHWHLKLPHSPFHLSLLLNSHICILNLKLEILSQIAFCPFSVVPSFDVYLVIHRKKERLIITNVTT